MSYNDLVIPYPPYTEDDPAVVDAAAHLLECIGVDLTSQHTRMTPYRLAHYLAYWMRPVDTMRFTVFDNRDPFIDQVVVVDPIPFWACCSHHMLPFFGHVYFGYIPEDKLVGLSQIPMLIQSFCARPWLQETMTAGLADWLEDKLDPAGLGLIVTAIHTCQMLDLNGPPVPRMTFSEMRGAFKDDAATRAEFLRFSGFNGS